MSSTISFKSVGVDVGEDADYVLDGDPHKLVVSAIAGVKGRSKGALGLDVFEYTGI